jgi:hypothetical protein
MRLDPENLDVSTFETSNLAIGSSGGGYCCTGCVSGCGINPTAGGCASGGGGGTFDDTVMQKDIGY